jgi:hypothetical protein
MFTCVLLSCWLPIAAARVRDPGRSCTKMNASTMKSRMAVPWVRRLVAGFPARRPGFERGLGHVGFMVDKVIRFPVLSIPSTASHSSSSIMRGWYSRPVKLKAIPVTGLGGLYGCEILRIPHCLDNRFTVNCETLATCSSTYSPVCTSQEAHSVSIK